MIIEKYKFDKGGMSKEDIEREIDDVLYEYTRDERNFASYFISELGDHYSVQITKGMKYEIYYN